MKVKKVYSANKVIIPKLEEAIRAENRQDGESSSLRDIKSRYTEIVNVYFNATSLSDLGDIEQNALAEWILAQNKDPYILKTVFIDPVQWAVTNGFLPDGYIRGQYRLSLISDVSTEDNKKDK